MARKHGGLRQKVALPPGTLVHVGEKGLTEGRVAWLEYGREGFLRETAGAPRDPAALRDPAAVSWLRVTGLEQVEVIQEIGRNLGIHALVLEDVLNTTQRPKVEEYEGYTFLAAKALAPDPATGELGREQLSLILAGTCVVTFEEGRLGLWTVLADRLKAGKGRLHQLGPDYLAYALLDVVVDHYFAVLEGMDERLEGLEEAVLAGRGQEHLSALYRLKRQAVELRRAIWPLREVAGHLVRGESPQVGPEVLPFLRDLYDHVIQASDAAEMLRENLNALLDVHLSLTSNRMNQVMKVLTVIATIFIPLTFLAGVYGMNFEYMPELKQPWGYPAALGVMALVAVAMLRWFKRRGWL